MTETTKLIEEIKQIIDITSRVDERIKMIAESQQQINFRLNHFIDEHNALVARVHVVESKNGHKTQELVSVMDEKLMRNATRLEILETIGSQKSQKLSDDFIVFKSRVQDLENHKRGMSDKVNLAFSYILNGLFVLALGYIFYRLGLPMPQVP